MQATPELINYNGTAAYEVLLDSGTIYVDANLGAILNPVATNNVYVENDDDHDDKYRSKKQDSKRYKESERLIATSYQQYDEDEYDD